MASNTHTTESAQKASESVGMPQLDFSTFGNQIFWLLVTLIVIFFVLSKIALPRIEAILQARQTRITNYLSTAEYMKQKAVEAEATYNQVLADARTEVNKIVAEARAEIQAEVDAAATKADLEIFAKAAESEAAISDIRAGAVDGVKAVAKDAVKEILGIMGHKADAKTVTAAVTARMIRVRT